MSENHAVELLHTYAFQLNYPLESYNLIPTDSIFTPAKSSLKCIFKNQTIDGGANFVWSIK